MKAMMTVRNTTINSSRRAVYLAIAIMALIIPCNALAQRFSVESFRDLPNDISAFINPVKDRNDEGCALLKVIATSPDFAFSTPLGIAKRIDKTGEIWLYLPRGSKKITIKHAEWGVMRDYMFPSRLESHKTYELNVKEPALKTPVVIERPVVTTVTDTLVLTRVDTVLIKPQKRTVAFETDVLATIDYGGKAGYLTEGIMIAVMKRHGAYLRLATDFGKTGPLSGDCDRTGAIGGEDRFYSGQTRRKAFMATAGAIHRAGRHIAVFEGIGYASNTLAWQLAESEGGGYVRNSYFSHSGLVAEVGLMLRLGRMTVSASALTVKGKEWFGAIGIGWRFGKNIK